MGGSAGAGKLTVVLLHARIIPFDNLDHMPAEPLLRTEHVHKGAGH